MMLHIDYQSKDFPSLYGIPSSGVLDTSWDELLWAAITVGRPDTIHVFRYGPASFHEAIFRLSLVRMALNQEWSGHLRRSDAFAALDPTEKGMVSYFLGMALCKLFSSRLLYTPWLLHLDVFRSVLNPAILGRSRPDLVGENNFNRWHAFESKGRSSVPSWDDKTKAKTQAQRLVSINGTSCLLTIGSFAFFRGDYLEFFWIDPEADAKEPIELPRPNSEWRYYYEPSLSLAAATEDSALKVLRKEIDVEVKIHPKIQPLLDQGNWLQARETAGNLRDEFVAQGYQQDGIRVIAGEMWSEQSQKHTRYR